MTWPRRESQRESNSQNTIRLWVKTGERGVITEHEQNRLPARTYLPGFGAPGFDPRPHIILYIYIYITLKIFLFTKRFTVWGSLLGKKAGHTGWCAHKLCVRVLSSSCPAVVLWPAKACFILFSCCCPLATLANPVSSCIPAVLWPWLRAFVLLSSCLRPPPVRSLSGSVCPAWPRDGPGVMGSLRLVRVLSRPCPRLSCLSTLLTLHHRFVLALSPAWQRLFPFLHRFIYLSLRTYTCDNLRNQEPLFSDSFLAYMPFPKQTLPQTLELKELTPNKQCCICLGSMLT